MNESALALPDDTLASSRVEAETSSGFWQIFRSLGPGIVTGASDDDPSGIGTYAAVGAATGYGLLWTALFTFPLMVAVQYTCAKIGMVTGTGLTTVLKRHYSRPLLYAAVFSLLVANTINVGVDVGAVAAGINLLLPRASAAIMIVPLGIAILVLQVYCSYRTIAKIFKWLTLALFAYVGVAYFVSPDWKAVLHSTLVPSLKFDQANLSLLVGILGTTISPYLFFWQIEDEVEAKIAQGKTKSWQRRGTNEKELKGARWDVVLGMLFSNLVMFFIILSTAATLHATGKTEIGTAAEAAEALRPLAGEQCYRLMALGLIGTGLLAIPILASSGAYAVAQAFGWKCGLSKRPREAKGFYGAVAFATLAGLVVNFVGIGPVKALLWTAVINGFLAPPLLVLIMLVANNKSVMGQRTNGRALNVLGWTTTVLMAVAAVGLIATWI